MEVLFAGELVGKAIGTVAVTSSTGYFTTKSLDHLLSTPDKAKVQELLTRKLPTLQAILEAIDQNVVLDDDRHALDELLWQLRTSMEKVDDALDELEFYNLKKTCRGTLTASSPFMKLHLGPQISRKVSSCLKRLKSSMEELDLVSDGVANFLSHMGCMKKSKDSLDDLKLLRETSRWLTIDKVFGRDTEKEQLVQWLTTGLCAHQDVLAIAITGVGGMGKTTLAQYACHDERVLMHFDSIIWIHVSRHFDPLRLTRMILESLTKQVPAAESIDVLQNMLKRLLVSRRFLLILDDTWEEMLYKWQQFFIPLYECSVGSKIVITTRMGSVIHPIEYVLKRHGKYCMKLDLNGLGNKPMLEVFKSCVFPMVNIDDAQRFHLMSEEIVKRLHGCPLIATALGEYLWSKMDRCEWSSVLDPQFQYIAMPSVLEVLYLSYLNLSREVQNCFRYCSLFPPKQKFYIEELLDMWICSGIISQKSRNFGVKDTFNIEANARDYFDCLVRKSLLTVATPLEDQYIMPDLVYELARYLSSKEVWISASNSNICVPSTVRHLSIEAFSCEVIEDISQHTDFLRTLIIRGFDEPKVATNLMKLIQRSKSLRVLCLHGSNCVALKIAFSKLKHLRYVSASSIDASGLCEIFELHHMEVIKIQNVNCKEKMSLCGIGNLLKLRKLDLPGDTLSRISHIGRLTTLQELSGFSIRAEQGHLMEELRNLTRLQKVCLENVENVHNHAEAGSAELNNKPDIKSLCLQWSSDEDRFHDYEILDSLAPHEDLKQLIIRGYNGAIHPRWMNTSCLPNLLCLKLDGCVEWVYLPKLSTLRTLRHLYLGRLLKLGETNSQTEDMAQFEDWMPPRLLTLVVKDCHALSKLPDLPLTLQLLDISDSRVSHLPTMSVQQPSDSSTQLSQLRFELCKHLDPEPCLEQLGDYKALTDLSIISCSTLSYLPPESVFKRLSKLEKFNISDCERLSSLGGLGALGCLRELNIKKCPRLVTSTSLSQSMMWHSLLLGTLDIDDCSLLFVKPLRDLRNTEHLIISDGSRMATLPLNWLEENLSMLQSIEVRNAIALSTLVSGTGMENFTPLRRISLTNASALKLLPNMPPNLWAFKINGCHADFKSKYQRGGSGWRKISNIPDVTIM